MMCRTVDVVLASVLATLCILVHGVHIETSTTHTHRDLSHHHNQHKTRSSLTDCHIVRELFVEHHIGPASLVPDTPSHDADMEICYRGDRDTQKQSCCTRKMERKYHQMAERDFYDVVRSTSSYLKNVLTSHEALYRGSFMTDTQRAQNRTNSVLDEVHRLPLGERHNILNALFMDLQAFLKHREVNLHDTVAQFFDDLFPLVFQNVLNDPTTLTLDDKYRECLTEVRQNLYPSPFGDVPRHLAHSLSKSFTAARTFLEALSLGTEVVNSTDYMYLEMQCSRAITRMQYCPVCQGLVEARPCRNYCYNVMRGCMATVTQLDEPWNNFVDSLRKLTVNMRGPYDIEHVLHHLHSDVSDAVMHAMETGHKFYPQIVNQCGHAKTAPAGLSSSPGSSSGTGSETPVANAPHTPDLATRLETFMRSLLASKGFYNNVPDTLCSTERFATEMDQEHCWTGEEIGRYNKTLVDINLEIQMRDNPEMRVGTTYGTTIRTLMDKLQHVIRQLGSKVSSEMEQSDGWPIGYSYVGSGHGANEMDDEDFVDFSGSGSGSGPEYNYNPKPSHGRRQPSYAGPGDPDLYIDEENPQRSTPSAYIPNSLDASHRDTNVAPVQHPVAGIYVAVIGLMALWLNG